MIWLALANAASGGGPEVVLTFDNGGFNLPLYTERWTGEFAQPSVAQQLVADVARMRGASPRVFTYLPPGRAEGSSSEPTEIEARRPDCRGSDCACAPGERCWDGLDVNRSPAASTSLFQAAAGVRERLEGGPRIEVHFTDLFEEDPASVQRAADADRCVTVQSTRKAIEAVLDGVGGSLDHVAVGRLSVRIDPPRRSEGGVVRFEPSTGDCWSGRRTRGFGGDGHAVELDLAVLILGVDTASHDSDVQRFLQALPRQVSEPLALDLVTVREPGTVGLMAPQFLGAATGQLVLPPPLERLTPCEKVASETRLWSGGHAIQGGVDAGCGDAAVVHFTPQVLSGSFRRQAGLNPTVGTLEIAGEVVLHGDRAAIRKAVRELAADPARDRPLPHWSAVEQALRFEDAAGVARPRQHTVKIERLVVRDVDDRPWLLAILFSLVPFVLTALGGYALLARIAGNRAYRRHLEAASAQGRPVAVVLVEAAEEARSGWLSRLLVALVLAGFVALLCFFGLLFVDGLRG